MNKQLSDEQIDKLISSIVDSSAISDSEIDEIASSPTLWWSVQGEIAVRKEALTSPWPPSFSWLRVIGLAFPLLLLAVGAIGFLNFGSSDESTQTAGVKQNVVLPLTDTGKVPTTQPETSSLTIGFIGRKKAAVIPSTRRSPVEGQIVIKQTSEKLSRKPITSSAEEVRSEFIALSYAQNPSSGQIVRVKVPSSMKVTLGVVDRVDKPSELVDAEVVVGDDGMTHAIRFIRQ